MISHLLFSYRLVYAAIFSCFDHYNSLLTGLPLLVTLPLRLLTTIYFPYC